MASSVAVGENTSTLKDTAAIVEWQRATGARKTCLFNELFRAKAGLIRQLTQKAARAEKTSEDFEDLYQAGAIGFQKALTRFDAGRGYAISTYAAWWIRHEVQRVARQSQRIGLPRIRLTNDERQKVLGALKENPATTAEDVGVRRSQFDQVKASFGIRYVSDAIPKGAAALERKLLDEEGSFDGEETLDSVRRYRAMQRIISLVRAGHSAAGLGISPEAHNLALEVIRAEEIDMSEQSETVSSETTTTAKRRPGRPKGSKSSSKPAKVRPAKAKPAATVVMSAPLDRIVARVVARIEEQLVEKILKSLAA